MGTSLFVGQGSELFHNDQPATLLGTVHLEERPDTTPEAANPSNPSLPVVFVKVMRPGYPDLTRQLAPTRFSYISSVTAMDYMEMTFPDPDFEFIDSPYFEEDLRTMVEVRFGYLDGSNMSDPVRMVFYKQKPSYRESVQTTLTFFDEMIFFSLPLDSLLVEGKDGVTVKDLVNTMVAEVNAAWGRKISVEYDGHDFEGKWWRFNTTAATDESAGGQDNADQTVAGTVDGRQRGRNRRTGTPLEFLYGILRYAKASTSDTPIELFVQGDRLFFRPGRRNRRPIAHYRYFSKGDTSHAQLVFFEPEVNLKPSFQKVSSVDTQTGRANEATAGNDENKSAPNQTKGSASVHRTNVGNGAQQLRQGGVGGDVRAPQPEPKKEVKQYTVNTGDTLAGIASHLGVSEMQLLMENGLPLDPAKVQLTPNQVLKYTVVTYPPAANPNGTPQQAEKVVTGEQQAQAHRTYLTDEYKAVKAKATVFGHPNLKAGWPIYIDNVGRRWEGPWYIEEVQHSIDDNSPYLCELSLSRDGFMIAREAGTNSGYDPAQAQDYQDEPQTPEKQEYKGIHRTDARQGDQSTVMVRR